MHGDQGVALVLQEVRDSLFLAMGRSMRNDALSCREAVAPM